MRAFAIITLIALFAIPTFAQEPDASDQTTIDLTIVAYAGVEIDEGLYELMLDPGNNGGEDYDYCTVDFTVLCNYYHEVGYDLIGDGAEWWIEDSYYPGFGPGEWDGYVEVGVWADMTYEAGDFEGTLTVSVYAYVGEGD